MREGASPPRRDLAIVYPTSRLVGLEISHINATGRGGLALLVGLEIWQLYCTYAQIVHFSKNSQASPSCGDRISPCKQR